MMTRRSAVDCLRRAGLSLRANWPLVLLTLVQNMVVGVLFLLSLVPPFLVLGGHDLIKREWTLAALEEWLTGLLPALTDQVIPVSLAIVASTVIGFLAVLAWGWFQGGLYGVLVAAERQALPEAQNRSGGVRWFHTFGMKEFSGWGGRYAWRYFWFFHLNLTVGLILTLGVALLVFLTAYGYEAWGDGAAFGIGCGASLPLLFLFLVYALWSVTAQPYLAREDGRVMRAAGAGLRLVGRRPGALLLIVAFLFVVAVTLALVFLLGEAALSPLSDGVVALWAGLFAVWTILRMLLNSALGVYGKASFTSLAVSLRGRGGAVRRTGALRGPGAVGALAALLLLALWVAACRSAPPSPEPTAPAPPAAPVGGTEPPELAAPEAPLPLPEEGAPGESTGSTAPTEPTPPAPHWPANVEDGRLLVRVGLASDLLRYELPCCEGEVVLNVGGESLALRPPLTIEPAASSVSAPERRLQVAALRDEAQADALARDLGSRTGWPADVRFDASSGLYRVRVGRFTEEADVEAARRRVAGLGFGGAWPVQEGGEMTEPALRVRVGDRSYKVHGRWLVVRPGRSAGAGGEESGSLPVSTYERTGRYRGRLLFFLNPRGSLNLVNELPLEQYLRGVVPRELGPELYPRIEALKAQAVAARTYTLRHLGEFAGEGFDICAEPRCQVYGGQTAEHPLSDRAVAETAGEILRSGDEIVEALYSATCGGHTEDSRTVFPWLDVPYLRGVPCPEGEAVRLAGVVAAGTPFPDGLTERVLPSPRRAHGREALQERLETLARTAGLPPTGDRLRSLERGEVRRYVRSVFDLVLDPSLLIEPSAGEGAPGGRPPVVKTAREVDAVEVSGREAEWLMLSLARVLGLMEEEAVRFRAVESGALVVAGDGAGPASGGASVRRLELPHDLATFARLSPGVGDPAAAELALLPGDALVLYRWQGRLAAVLRDGGPDAPRPDSHPARASRFRNWSRFRSDRQLANLVGERYPGLGFQGLEVLTRGVSGRVGRLRILGNGGRSEVVEGLAVRWTLDLPDTRFEARRATGPGGEAGWSFTGGGWGHGVGMCQVGAYALAGRGLSYREILEHYYTGARLSRALVR